ncbi:hypothetical protein DSO57_1014217 [Entomophthora muscae]|uniref:Uncharacterized protein n=1 Tax=Entomophthora muscae TaxID=34485 RepID=A0ACC2SV44_9FUNG|nr:hypothetical protein DSO57_1014217 [Entomophthora muscae]
MQLSLSPKQLNALKHTTTIDDNRNPNPLSGQTDIDFVPQIISPASLKRQYSELSINSEIPQGKRPCTLPVDIPTPTYDIDAAYNAAFADSDSEVDAFIEFDFDNLSSFSLDSDDDGLL